MEILISYSSPGFGHYGVGTDRQKQNKTGKHIVEKRYVAWCFPKTGDFYCISPGLAVEAVSQNGCFLRRRFLSRSQTAIRRHLLQETIKVFFPPRSVPPIPLSDPYNNWYHAARPTPHGAKGCFVQLSKCVSRRKVSRQLCVAYSRGDKWDK